MATKPRPISPHVQIYSFPTPALTSITHRATGVALSAGTLPANLPSLTMRKHQLPPFSFHQCGA